jgi:hypothetical protein
VPGLWAITEPAFFATTSFTPRFRRAEDFSFHIAENDEKSGNQNVFHPLPLLMGATRMRPMWEWHISFLFAGGTLPVAVSDS